MKTRQIIGIGIWFLIAKNLPKSIFPVIGPFAKTLRRLCASLIFKKVGVGVNVENKAYFGNGNDIEIGDYSGIGKNCRVPSNIKIGRYVMMGEDVIILNQNHNFEDVSLPINKQGYLPKTQLTIGDDVWIGTRAIVLPQVTKIGNGVIIGGGSVVTRNIEDNAIVGGNPARVIRIRKSK